MDTDQDWGLQLITTSLNMKIVLALAVLLAVAYATPAKLGKVDAEQCDNCDGTCCDGGCCPYVGWYCCPDGLYCAATAADCPLVNKAEKLASLATKKSADDCNEQTCPGGTCCPGGCCPYDGWYCCPDGMYCAATAGDCPIKKF